MELRGKLILKNNITFMPLPQQEQIYYATGGDYKCNMGNFAYHVYLSSGKFTVLSNISSAEIFAVGGGAGGDNRESGGGGAGGIDRRIDVDFTTRILEYFVEVAESSKPMQVGKNTTLYYDTLLGYKYITYVYGGGFGSCEIAPDAPGFDISSPQGGAGGGGGGSSATGGNGIRNGGSGDARGCGGGGGHSAKGGDAKSDDGGGGGSGINLETMWPQVIQGVIGGMIVGVNGLFAGGGGGSGSGGNAKGGAGGGGNGEDISIAPSVNGLPNTGGGGGGGLNGDSNASTGGSGILIIRYRVR